MKVNPHLSPQTCLFSYHVFRWSYNVFFLSVLGSSGSIYHFLPTNAKYRDNHLKVQNNLPWLFLILENSSKHCTVNEVNGYLVFLILNILKGYLNKHNRQGLFEINDACVQIHLILESLSMPHWFLLSISNKRITLLKAMMPISQ